MNKYFVESDEMVSEALKLLGDVDIVGCDTETDGFDHFGGTLWCVQLSNDEYGFLFPWNALSEESKNKVRIYCEGKTIIAHNAKFDYKFLTQNGFIIKECYCTFVSEKILYQGKYFTFGLKDVLLRRFQIKMDKEIREDFYNGVFAEQEKLYGKWGIWEQRPDLVEYALDDIEYLSEIRNAQLEEAEAMGMTNLLRMENLNVKVVADIELKGVWGDTEAIKKFESVVNEKRDILGQEIFTALETSWNDYWLKEYTRRAEMDRKWQVGHKEIVAVSNKMRNAEDRRKKSEEALKMVADSLKKRPFSSLPKLENHFNPNSPQKLKVGLEGVTGIKIPNTRKEWLEENIHLHDAIEKLVEYRKFEKLSQFCAIQEDVNPHTGRIHGRLDQVGTESGRFSHSNPNLGQIPARTEEGRQFRAFFKPQEGYKYIQADYAGLELVILADASNEKILIDAINRGDDLHCFTMSLMMDCPYQILFNIKEDVSITEEDEEIFRGACKKFTDNFNLPELLKIDYVTSSKSWVKKLRDYVKTITYGTAYGLSAYGLSNKFHCSFEVAEQFIKYFFTVYKNLDGFLKTEGELGLQRGYALNPFGRRRYFTKPRTKSYAEIEAEIIKDLDKQKRLWDSVTDEEWEQLVRDAEDQAKKEYRAKLNSIKRRSANFYPQSVNADMTKTAMYLFDKYYGKGMILIIHDEIIAEVPDEDVECGSIALKKAMEQSGKKFVKNCKIEVEVKVMERWEK